MTSLGTDYIGEIKAEKGERFEFNKAKLLNEELAIQRVANLECPCGVTGNWTRCGDLSDDEGDFFLFECMSCGTQIKSGQVVKPVFNWLFDNNSHEIWWDISTLMQLVADHNDLCPLIEIPAEWVKVFFESNPSSVDDHDYAMTRPLDEPILVVEHPSVANHYEEMRLTVPPILPVDGWHRIFKARALGKSIAARLIPRCIEETARVREQFYLGYSTDHLCQQKTNSPPTPKSLSRKERLSKRMKSRLRD